MKGDNETVVSDQSLKQRRHKPREVSSRFLSPPARSYSNGIPSPGQSASPVHQKSTLTKHQSFDNYGRFIRGIWPSSSSSQSPKSKTTGTLADHLQNERLDNQDLEHDKDEKGANKNGIFSLGRQRSYRENGRFDGEKEKESAKENHRPSLGGSMRYTGKLHFSGKTSTFSSSSSNNSGFVPRRMSVDENTLYRNLPSASISRRKSDCFIDSLDSEFECSDLDSVMDINTAKPRKSDFEFSSKYSTGIPPMPYGVASDSDFQNPVQPDASTPTKKSTSKITFKRTNSLAVYGTATSQWALSPGRSGSPPMSVESKERPMSFSSLRPPSPSRRKGVEKLLNLGRDLFKGKKSSSSSSLVAAVPGNVEKIHELRLLHNRLMQWRYSNAAADAVNENINEKLQNNLACAWISLTTLQQSVLHKRLQLQKGKLEMKLDNVLHSQMKLLESWGDMERQHSSAVTMTKECLHSVVCRVPLTNCAKVDIQSVSLALRHASDLTDSIGLPFTAFSSPAKKTVKVLSQLADVVAQERALLEGCIELLRDISVLRIQETSLKCYAIQANLWQQQQQNSKVVKAIYDFTTVTVAS